MRSWNSQCQPGGRWVGMCSEAWCLNTRETRVGTVWSSTPGGHFQKSVPACSSALVLVLNYKTSESLKLVGFEPERLLCWFFLFNMFLIQVCQLLRVHRSKIQTLSTKCKCLPKNSKCQLKVNTQASICGWVTHNELNKINWEPIKTNAGCCELYLPAKQRQQQGEKDSRVFQGIERVSSLLCHPWWRLLATLMLSIVSKPLLASLHILAIISKWSCEQSSNFIYLPNTQRAEEHCGRKKRT